MSEHDGGRDRRKEADQDAHECPGNDLFTAEYSVACDLGKGLGKSQCDSKAVQGPPAEAYAPAPLSSAAPLLGVLGQHPPGGC